MKICIECFNEKRLLDFELNLKEKDKRSKICKQCEKDKIKKRSRTIKGLISNIYRNQLYNSRKRNHKKPTYTNKELLKKALKTDRFMELYIDWILSNYKHELVPTFDRKDDSNGYSFDNLNDWMTWNDNRKKNHKTKTYDNKAFGKKRKPVIQYNLDGKIIREYKSINSIKKELGFNQSNISNVCLGKFDKAYGYKWEFKNK